MALHPLPLLAGFLLVMTTVGGVFLYERLTVSLEATVAEGPVKGHATQGTPPTDGEVSRVVQRLRDVGLNEAPVLGDTAVSGHRQRLEGGEIGADALHRYADDLAYLNRFTASQGGAIPTVFWDVRTEEMTAHEWDEYTLVHDLVGPGMEAYLRLLALGYGRFVQFKAREASGDDTALDAALDLFAHVGAYYEAVPDAALTEHAKGVEGEAEEVLLIWQSLVAGTTRVNPLTGKPLFSHSIFARDNVGTMYQHAQGRGISIADVWGVTGFAHRFVGTLANNNQVEHMSISMVLQLLLGEPVLVLDGIEEEKTLLGHAAHAEAKADMALNNAIHHEFAPFFADDWRGAVERLRGFLKADDE